MRCPKCGGNMIEQEGVYCCTSCFAKFKRKTPASPSTPAPTKTSAPMAAAVVASVPTPPTPEKPLTPEQERIAELEKRLAEVEKQNAGKGEKKKNDKNPWQRFTGFVKKHKVVSIIVVAVLVLTAVLIPLLVTFCGVRGIYVCEDNPYEYYEFRVSEFSSVEITPAGEVKAKGTYDISGSKITFTVEDTLFGEITVDESFKKVDGNSMISIGGVRYERVGFYKSGKVKIKFDAQGGTGGTTKKVQMGKRLSSIPTPTRIGYIFKGWKDAKGNALEEMDPQWKDKTYYATWEVCTHPTAISCIDTVCPICGKKVSDMSEEEINVLTHNLDGNCRCADCGSYVHDYNEFGVCEHCGVASVTIVNGVVTGVGNFLGSNLVIPYGATSIADSAFENCTGLTSVTIPDSVTSIGEKAFNNCNNLSFASIPKSVTTIGSYVFNDCSSLEEMTIPSIDGSKTWNKTLKYFFGNKNPPSRLRAVTILGGASINSSAFKDCTSLASIIISDSVTSIGTDAFRGCTSLNSVTFGEESQLTSIGSNAFRNCYMLTSITIPSNVTSIGDSAFDQCYKLVEVHNNSALSIIKNTFDFGYVGYYAKNIYKTKIGSKLTITEDNYVLYTEGETVSLISYIGSENALILPNEVTEINDYAFYSCSRLISVEFPENLVSIGEYAFCDCTGIKSFDFAETDHLTTIQYSAFQGCKGLKSIEIPDGVTKIASCAFQLCSNLTSITIPSSVTDIGIWVLSGCRALNSIEVDSGNAIYHSDGNCLIQTEKKELIAGCKSSVIPEDGSVISIGYYAFSGCTGLSSVTIPDGVTNIGENAFYGCAGLSSIVIPKSVTSIRSYAFNNCSFLRTVDVLEGSKLSSIEEGAFYGCTNLIEVLNMSELPITKGSTDYGYIGYYAKNVCTSVEEKKLSSQEDGLLLFSDEDGVLVIGCNSSKTSVILPSNIIEIYQNAFSGCNELTSIFYEGDLAGWCKISGLNNLMSDTRTLYINGNKVEGDLVIPTGVTAIGEYAFYHCSGLTSVTIPDSVKSIGRFAFSGCDGLTSITLPFLGATSDGLSNAYLGYLFGASSYSSKVVPSSLKTVTITSGTSIEDYAFYGCNSLISIAIPDGVTNIGAYAFYGCNSLISIAIPDGVTNIGESAFSGCTSLEYNEYGNGKYIGKVGNPYWIFFKAKDTSIAQCTIHENTRIINDSAFYRCVDLISITIPDGVTSIESWAFSHCDELTTVTIPASVMNIADRAFNGCSKTFSIIFQGTKAQWEAINKSILWNVNTGATYNVVHCTDGDVEAPYLRDV